MGDVIDFSFWSFSSGNKIYVNCSGMLYTSLKFPSHELKHKDRRMAEKDERRAVADRIDAKGRSELSAHFAAITLCN